MAGVSMKDIKLRIKSMENTEHITKAMEMVASSKMRRAQEKVQQSRPYFELMYSTLTDIAEHNSDITSPYVSVRDIKKKCYIVIAGDRGLAGGYNHNILKLAEDDMGRFPSTSVPIGKKALETLTNHKRELYSTDYPIAANISISDSFTLAKSLCEGFLRGEFDELYIAYTNFVSMLNQTPVIIKVLPLGGEFSIKSDGVQMLTIYEPDSESVFDTVVPEYVGGMIYGALCESIASEQSARRNAMESATNNAEDMIEDLNLKYNRARQGAITQEITEIIAGADT